jgi:transketolase
VIYSPDEEFNVGEAKVVRQSDGDRITIVGAGVTLFEALAAADKLKAEGIPVRVIDIFSVKPIDLETLLASGEKTGGLILTVEDHSDGGIGDAVAGAVSPYGIRVHQLAVRELPRSGKPEELLAAYGIDRAAIAGKVRSLLAGGSFIRSQKPGEGLFTARLTIRILAPGSWFLASIRIS